jgi:hypothetical protein
MLGPSLRVLANRGGDILPRFFIATEDGPVSEQVNPASQLLLSRVIPATCRRHRRPQV